MFQDDEKKLNEVDLHTWNQYVKGNFIVLKNNLVKKKINNCSKNSFDQKNNKNYKETNFKNKKRLSINENKYFFDRNADKKTLKRIKKNKIKPDKVLDLHGKTKYEGKICAIKFIRECYFTNKRFLLIITGKGSSFSSTNSFLEQKSGILRRSFPDWLKNDTICSYILNYTSAHNFNGGEGAYYVFLKKNKSL